MKKLIGAKLPYKSLYIKLQDFKHIDSHNYNFIQVLNESEKIVLRATWILSYIRNYDQCTIFSNVFVIYFNTSRYLCDIWHIIICLFIIYDHHQFALLSTKLNVLAFIFRHAWFIPFQSNCSAWLATMEHPQTQPELFQNARHACSRWLKLNAHKVHTGMQTCIMA